jgi:general secretion pathway protein K
MMRNKNGYVLVIVLLILAITTALVIDFTGTVYGYVSTANNFNESERMSLLLKSAYLLTTEKALSLSLQLGPSAQKEISFEEKIEDTTVGLLLEDNNSKFNVNLIGHTNPVLSETRLGIFSRLLLELRIDEKYAERLADFIDSNKNPGVPGGEDKAKNYSLYSLSELGYIFPEDDLKKVLPYLTVFGDGKININTADLPLLKALHPGMSETLAKSIVEAREVKPFGNMDELSRVLGNMMVTQMSDLITNKDNTTIKQSDSFSVVITAERNDLIETAEAGFDLSSGRIVTKYWRER